MTIQQDKEDLLDALYARHLVTGKRSSIIDVQTECFPEWERERTFDVAKALEGSGDILNVTGATLYVDLSSAARNRAAERRDRPPSSQTIRIDHNYNSPIQQIGPDGHGTQTTHYQISKNDLRKIVDIYRNHVDELKLDAAERRRADAQVATIEAQLQDEPDPTIVRAAGRSLKAIIEGALGGALANVISNPGVWAPLLSLFG